MKEEEVIKQELNELTDKNVESILKILEGHEKDIFKYLANIISSLCDVTYDDLMSANKKHYTSQARWLFWYAYRYMTNEPYNKMAERLGKNGHTFNHTSIPYGVSKMSMMIANEPIWSRRWSVVKRILKTYNDATTNPVYDEAPKIVKIVIHKPANVDVKVDIKAEK